jgi:hypothetical protein
MMGPPASIKAGFVHIRAFTPTVVARLDRATQYSKDACG